MGLQEILCRELYMGESPVESWLAGSVRDRQPLNFEHRNLVKGHQPSRHICPKRFSLRDWLLCPVSIIVTILCLSVETGPPVLTKSGHCGRYWLSVTSQFSVETGPLCWPRVAIVKDYIGFNLCHCGGYWLFMTSPLHPCFKTGPQHWSISGCVVTVTCV